MRIHLGSERLHFYLSDALVQGGFKAFPLANLPDTIAIQGSNFTLTASMAETRNHKVCHQGGVIRISIALMLLPPASDAVAATGFYMERVLPGIQICERDAALGANVLPGSIKPGQLVCIRTVCGEENSNAAYSNVSTFWLSGGQFAS